MGRSSPFALSPDWGMVPLRVLVGLVFLMHGYQKLFVFGLDGTTNFMVLGGLALLFGVFTRWAALLLAGNTAAAVLAVLLMLLAPGSAEAQKSKRRCTGEPADSLAQLQAPIYRDCDVDEPAALRGADPPLDYRPSTPRAGCSKVELQFVVDSMGVPEPGVIRLRSGTNPEFEEAVRASVGELRYQPARLSGHAVRQVVVYKRSVVAVVRVVSSTGGGGPLPVPRSAVPRC